jgi:hypothetical protein
MEKTYINARFRSEVIVPSLGISPNFEFLTATDKRGKILYTKDGVRAKVFSCDTKLAFDLEKEIKELYNISVWEYLCKWNEACEGQLSSLYLHHIQLTKEE